MPVVLHLDRPLISGSLCGGFKSESTNAAKLIKGKSSIMTTPMDHPPIYTYSKWVCR